MIRPNTRNSVVTKSKYDSAVMSGCSASDEKPIRKPAAYGRMK